MKKFIKKEINQAYDSFGQASAFDVANKYPEHISYEYCNGCMTESPVFKNTHECLICGQETDFLLTKLSK